MNTRPKEPAVIDRSDAEAALARVAVAAFTYYPEKHTDEPGYVVEEDVEWAVEPLRMLADEAREQWRRRVIRVIVDPAADRQTFVADLMALAGTRESNPPMARG